ncbi:MAG: phosphatase PAP2 family protein [Ignavibacteriales bacterium]
MSEVEAIGPVEARHGTGDTEAFVEAFVVEARRDWPVFAIVAAYAGAAWLLCCLLGRLDYYHPLLYMPLSFGTMTTAAGAYVLLVEAPKAVIGEPRAPMTALLRRLKARAHPEFLVSLGVFLAAGLFTSLFTCMKSLLNEVVPFRSDVALAKLDAALFLGHDPWRLLAPLLDNHPVVRVVQNLYLTGWLLALIGFVGAASFAKRLKPVRLRFFLTYFTAWVVLGNLIAAAFMSAGPAFFGALTGDQSRYGGLLHHLAFSEGLPNSSVTLQQMLWSSYTRHQVEPGAGISAFPSLHVAMATLFALTAFQLDRRLGWAMTIFAATIFTGSVALGWHYAADGLFSAGFVVAVWFGLGRLNPKPAA